MRSIVFVCLILLIKATQISLGDEGYTRNLPPNSTVDVTIDSRQPYLYIEIVSCASHVLSVSDSKDNVLKPQTILQPSNFLYKINATAKVNLKSTEQTKMKMLPVKNDKDLPHNNFGIDAYFDDDSLIVAFEPIKLFDQVATANYSIWFAAKSQDIQCPMLFNDVSRSGVGVIRVPATESEKLLLEIEVPLVDKKEQADNNVYVNRIEIMDLLSGRESFYVGIVVDVQLPAKMTFVYQPIKVDHQLNILELEVGLAIMLIGVMVYALVSITYLYCKRKYKNDGEFEEEMEEEGGKSESQNEVVS